VTGSASGMGHGLSMALAERGMNVVVADWNADGAERTAVDLKQLGVDAIAVHTDVSNVDSVNHLADVAFEQFGSVQLLVNNAAVHRAGPLWETPVEDWDWLIGVNLKGIIHGLNAFLPRMMCQADERHIVMTASTNGLWIMPRQGAYNTTKYAVVGLAEALANDLDLEGITVSVVCPGPMRTHLGQNPPPSGTGQGPVYTAKLRQMMATWPMLEPLEAGRIVRSAIEANEFWIFPHAQGLEEIEERYRSLTAAFQRRIARGPELASLIGRKGTV
jgi:NAD(P)-dependent dehydrogenase (short-subunit alcohol dehydrogenase family)